MLPAAVAAAAPREQHEAPAWLPYLALPFFLVLIFSDISEVLITHLGVPSLLQLSLFALMVLIWFYRDALRPSRVLLQPLTLAFAAYAAMVFFSTLWADDLSLADRHVERIVKNLLIYGVVAILAVGPALRRSIATTVLVAAALSTISIAQIATGNTFHELGGLATVAYGNIYGDSSDARAAGPMGDANFYGQVLVMVIPLAVYLAWSSPRRRWRAFWLATALALAGGVLVSYSRGAMLALALMTALMLAALRVPLTRVAMATAAAVLLLLVMPGNIGKRFMTFEALVPGEQYYVAPDSSFEKRKLLTATAARMFDDNPWLGVGAGNYPAFFPRYSNQVGSEAVLFYRPGGFEHAHSLYLEIGSEMGLIGLGVFGILLLAAAAQLWGARREPATMWLSIAGVSFLVTSLFLHGSSQRYFALLLAFVAALTARAQTGADTSDAAQDSREPDLDGPAPDDTVGVT